jgi:hypothetical protein
MLKVARPKLRPAPKTRKLPVGIEELLGIAITLTLLAILVFLLAGTLWGPQ